MFGAAFSLTLLLLTGVNTISLAAVVVTGLLTTVSVLLFGGLRAVWPFRKPEDGT